MIKIINRQRKIKVNETRLKKIIATMLANLSYKDFDIGILFTTNKTIKKYNKTYRNKDQATDILSFPYHTNLKAGQKIIVKNPEDKNLGDIIISLEYAQKAAPEWNRFLQQHLIALLAHGIAHLLGYDHETDKQAMQMEKIEKKLIKIV
ncbi:MAG: rRNA maturation RNase YbeY [bacterium]